MVSTTTKMDQTSSDVRIKWRMSKVFSTGKKKQSTKCPFRDHLSPALGNKFGVRVAVKLNSEICDGYTQFGVLDFQVEV